MKNWVSNDALDDAVGECDDAESFTMLRPVGMADCIENTRLKPSTGLSLSQLMDKASVAMLKRV